MQSLLQSLGVFFLFLIAILLLLILGIVLVVVILIRSLSSTNVIYQQAKDSVEEAVLAIAKEWQIQELRNRSTSQMLESADSGQWQHNLQQCQAKLGQITLYKGSQGSIQGLPIFKDFKPLIRIMSKKSDLELLKASENLILGEYIAQADFEGGVAKFEMQLLKLDEQWLINSLVITINDFDTSATEMDIFTFGQKTTIQTLVEEKKKRLQLEKLIE